MPLYINTNTASLNAQRYLGLNSQALQSSMEKLSSGYRINKAGDDAAGLQLSEKLKAQINGSQQALSNTQDGINVLNIADGAMQTMTDDLQRVRELAVQAGNDTYSGNQRTAIQNEMTQLLQDIDRISAATSFNGVPLFPTAATPFVLQVGANNTVNVDTIDVGAALGDTRANTLGITWWDTTNGVLTSPINTGANARTLLGQVDNAIDAINTKRGNLGAYVNRLQGAANNLSVGVQNLSSSEARIRDVDVAAESGKMTQNQILQQASQAMLAQANQLPSLALKLLQG